MKNINLAFFLVLNIFCFISCTPKVAEKAPLTDSTVVAVNTLINDNTVKDIDGNVYHTVTIGSQTWMVENLRTTKYLNGDIINTTSPVTKDLSSDPSHDYQWVYNDDEVNLAKYGRLYTWTAVTDTRNIAPTGWHVPTDAEWTTLENYLNDNFGTSLNTAKALAASTDWTTNESVGAIGCNPSINNYSGFKGLPGGFRNHDGTFYGTSDTGYWWTATAAEFDATAYYRSLEGYDGGVFRSFFNEQYGLSVRCIKSDNTTTSSEENYKPNNEDNRTTSGLPNWLLGSAWKAYDTNGELLLSVSFINKNYLTFEMYGFSSERCEYGIPQNGTFLSFRYRSKYMELYFDNYNHTLETKTGVRFSR
jgi:uncharacterized protein (TIGR02145 family)